ncbi:MAG: diguanylate cyclase, partial [Frankiaceae bacterium]|nr:diguanylate cyclase [Frankiaceae bacterium]
MPRLRAFPTLLCAVAALYVAWIALRFGGADVTVHVAQYGAVLGAALGAAGCAIAAWRLTGRARTCWLLLAAGCAAWGLGETVWSYYELVEHIEVPFPSLADVGYLAMFPFVIAALG